MTYWSGTIDPVDRARDGARRGHWLFTSRRGGISVEPFNELNLANHIGDDEHAVAANRRSLANLTGCSEIVFMSQHHSNLVHWVRPPLEGQPPHVDAIVTSEADVALVALSADCVPVALIDADAGIVAAVHSGWQGMVTDVVGAALTRMWDAGATPDGTRALLGPAICGRCYPVPAERADQAAQVAPQAVVQAHNGQPGIDVRAGLTALLRTKGVHVESVGGCTAEDPQLFSYRRDDRTGRQGVAVWLS